jgi:hypothetical protein
MARRLVGPKSNLHKKISKVYNIYIVENRQDKINNYCASSVGTVSLVFHEIRLSQYTEYSQIWKLVCVIRQIKKPTKLQKNE